MPGFDPKQTQKKTYEKLPQDTFLRLEQDKTHIVRFLTAVLPCTEGQWIHRVKLPKSNIPAAVPCTGKDTCAICAHNEGLAKDDPKRIPSGSRWVALAANLGYIEGGKFWKHKEPLVGIVDKGQGFWLALDSLERSVSIANELEPDKKLLPQDWREWYVKLTISGGSKPDYAMVAIPHSDKFPLWECPVDVLDRYEGLVARVLKPWDDVPGMLKRLFTPVAQPVQGPKGGMDDIEASEAAEKGEEVPY